MRRFTQPLTLLRRYPDTQVIWAANDPIALGAIAASVDEGRSPGRDLFVGGINWDKAGLEKIIDGEMAVSLGGHFMTGGWALIMLYDYYHGVDFASEGFSLKRPIFGIADISNASCLHDLVSQASWRKINFRSLSKKENSELKQYSFSSPRCTSSQIDQALK